jgi:dihydrofolate reductase
MIALIWAQARDTTGRPVIGAGGDIPWRVAEDFARFRALTSGHPVVMGRRTWDSLPRKPLPGRTNVVVTRNTAWSPDDDAAVVAHSLHQALAVAEAAPGGDVVWVIGGGQVYEEALPLADRLEVTEIDLEVAGDTVAPGVHVGGDAGVWHEAEHGHGDWLTPAAAGAPRYRFRTYVRRVAPRKTI